MVNYDEADPLIVVQVATLSARTASSLPSEVRVAPFSERGRRRAAMTRGRAGQLCCFDQMRSATYTSP